MQQNQVIVITGGTRGLGRALAIAFAKQSARVYVTGTNAQHIESFDREAKAQGWAISAFSSDIADPQDHQTLIEKIRNDGHSRIDILIHNASLLGPRVPLSEYPEESFARVLKVNLEGPFALTQKLLPWLGQGACMLWISSGVGVIGKARWGAYSISKFGLEGMAQIWAEELKPRGVRVYTIDPGSMRTAMRAEAYPDEDPQTLPTPESLTSGYLWLAQHGTLEDSGKRYKLKDLMASLV